MNNEDIIGTREAADALGLTRQRIQAMINQRCPICKRKGCHRCLGTGKYLPAFKLGNKKLSPWMIRRKSLELVRNRKRGRPPKKH